MSDYFCQERYPDLKVTSQFAFQKYCTQCSFFPMPSLHQHRLLLNRSSTNWTGGKSTYSSFDLHFFHQQRGQINIIMFISYLHFFLFELSACV